MLWFLGQLPGYYCYDTFKHLSQIYRHSINDRASYLYPPFLAAIRLFSHDLMLLGIIMAGVSTFTMSYIWVWCLKRGAPASMVFVLFVLFWLSPINYIFPFYYNRDVVFAWVFLGLLFVIFKYFIDHGTHRPIPFRVFWVISIWTSLVSALRQEAIIFMALIPLALWGLSCTGWRVYGRYLIVHSFIGFLILFLIPWSVGVNRDRGYYQLSAVITPLSYILKHSNPDDLSGRDRSNLENVIPISTMLEHQHDYRTLVYDMGLISPDLSASVYSRFNWTALKIFAQHPLLFWESRLLMNRFQWGFADGNYYYSDFLMKIDGAEDGWFKKYKGIFSDIKKRPFSERLQSLGDQYSEAILTNPAFGFLKWILATPILSTLLCLGFVVMFRRIPATATICALILSRSLIVFLVAGEVNFRYMYPDFLFGWILLPLMFVDLKSNIQHRGHEKQARVVEV